MSGALTIAVFIALGHGKDDPPPIDPGKTAFIVPEWTSCASTYGPKEGLVIRCEPMLLAEVKDVDGKQTLDAYVKEMRHVIEAPDAPSKPATFRVSDTISLPGARLTAGASVVLLTFAPQQKQRRRMSCVTRENKDLEATCEKLFAFFAGPVSLSEWQAAKSAAPWGPPLADDARVKKLIDAAQQGEPFKALIAPSLVVGPGLWWWLTQTDPALSELGTPSKAAISGNMVPMRTFASGAIAAFLRSKGATSLFHRFAKGKVRAASDDERKAFYQTIPFEIDGKPISVVDRGQTQLLMSLGDDGKLTWLELITDPDKQDFAGVGP